MVSEDSQDFRWLLMIHRLHYFSDFNQTGFSEVLALLHQTKHLDELREVDSLRSSKLVLLKETVLEMETLRDIKGALDMSDKLCDSAYTACGCP